MALCASPCSIAYSIFSIFKTRSFLLHSVEVDGQVVRLERSKTRDEYGYSYAPVFAFTAADGKSYTVTSDLSSSPPGFSEGEPVKVRYDPKTPENARIHTLFQTWGAAIMGAFGGVFLLIWGWFVLRRFGANW
jgi:hypothetical protein